MLTRKHQQRAENCDEDLCWQWEESQNSMQMTSTGMCKMVTKTFPQAKGTQNTFKAIITWEIESESIRCKDGNLQHALCEK